MMELNLRWLAFSLTFVGLSLALTFHFGAGPLNLSCQSVNRQLGREEGDHSSSRSSTRSFSSQSSSPDLASGDYPPRSSSDDVVRLAYLLTGSKGDGNRMKRLLLALYHPQNEYLLHIDRESPVSERLDLARFVAFHPIFLQVGNVRFIVKSNLVTYPGPTMISTTLHGMSVLLREKSKWDWFINLSASDYPLITQDDFLHVLSSSVPRGLNFIEHTSEIPGYKMDQRVRSMLIDPAIYRSVKSDLFYVQEKREAPNAFRVFQGSAWMMLSFDFCEYLIYGWDNLPRLALMYFANVLSSPESYFHTVVCNSKEHFNTTVNTDLHFIAWPNPPSQHPMFLDSSFYGHMVNASVPFARKFKEGEPLLDTIDAELLRGRTKGRVVVGGWCARTETEGDEQLPGDKGNNSSSSGGGGEGGEGGGGEGGGGGGGGGDGPDPCSVVGDPLVLQPGKGAKRFESLIHRVLEPKNFRGRQCV